MDDSPAALKAFEYLLDWIKPEDEVLLLTIARSVSSFKAISFIDSSAIDKLKQEVEAQLKELLRGYSQKLAMSGCRHSCLLGKGTVREAIVEEATFHEVDLIVLGRRQLSGIKRSLSGSNSTYVVEHAPCAVLVVKTELETEEKERKKAVLIQH